MMALGPKKKKTVILAVAVFVLLAVVSVVIDYMMNSGRIAILGIIIGAVAAAVILIISKLSEKKNDAYTYGNDGFEPKPWDSDFAAEEEEDNRFRRVRHDEDASDIHPEDIPAAEIPSDSQRGKVLTPSEELRARGFFGRKKEQQKEPVFDTPVQDEQYDFDAEPSFEESMTYGDDMDYAPEFDEAQPQYDGFDDVPETGFDDEDFDGPVLAFGDPTDSTGDLVSGGYEAEPYEELAEEPAVEEELVYEPEAEQEIPEQPPVQQPAAASTSLVRDIGPNTVVASTSPGQTIDSFFDGMSEDDIVYRDCVEVWASGAKNPMMKLLKYIDAIDDKKTADLLGRECEYINAMLDRMLYFSQMDMIDQALNMREYNFSALVKDCLKRFSPFFMEKKIGLLWKGLDVNVITDRRWFIFALTQIIFNSVEFTPVGGKIAISAKKTDDYIDLIIDDSGEGIDPEELPYVFVAGFMGDSAPNPNDTRTGMGLFICRTVLQKLGGECMAESIKGKGTRIIMRLPAIKEA